MSSYADRPHLCYDCRPDLVGVGGRPPHTKPGASSETCQCGSRTCACYATTPAGMAEADKVRAEARVREAARG